MATRCNDCGHIWEGTWTIRTRCPVCNSNQSFSLRENLAAFKEPIVQSQAKKR